MERSKLVAVLTGAISLLLGIAYLVLVQILDWRGEMLPAPIEGMVSTLFLGVEETLFQTARENLLSINAG